MITPGRAHLVKLDVKRVPRRPDMRHPVRMGPAHTPAPDTSTWPTQTQAAVQLGTNERTIRRWIEAGRLKTALRPAVGRKPLVIVDPADVARVRIERQPAVQIEPSRTGIDPGLIDPAPGPDTRQVVRAVDYNQRDPITGADASVVTALLKAMFAAASAAVPKPWLTTAEAVEYSGLPKAWLLEQARKGKIRAVNVGSGSRERWRFNREALIK